MKLLHVDSSIVGDASVSRQLSAAIVSRLRKANPDLRVGYRDLAAQPVPHLSGAYLAAQAVAPQQHTPEMLHDLALGGELLDEFMGANVVVIGAPMYNFGIPSQLKAWIDRLMVAGKTFRYTDTGVEGLVGGKTIIIASARGGLYAPGTPLATVDFQEPYLRAVFGFIGITDIRIVRAEGVALGEDSRDKALAAAKLELVNLSLT